MFSEAEVKSLWRTLVIFYSKLGEPCLCGAQGLKTLKILPAFLGMSKFFVTLCWSDLNQQQKYNTVVFSCGLGAVLGAESKLTIKLCACLLWIKLLHMYFILFTITYYLKLVTWLKARFFTRHHLGLFLV